MTALGGCETTLVMLAAGGELGLLPGDGPGSSTTCDVNSRRQAARLQLPATLPRATFTHLVIWHLYAMVAFQQYSLKASRTLQAGGYDTGRYEGHTFG